MPDLIVDTSVVIAFFKGERGWEAAGDLLSRAGMCSVNAAELVAKFIDFGKSGAEARELVRALGIEIVPADETLALDSGALREGTRHLGLSLGDRFCLALGRRERLPVYTADRQWAGFSGDIDVRLIR